MSSSASNNLVYFQKQPMFQILCSSFFMNEQFTSLIFQFKTYILLRYLQYMWMNYKNYYVLLLLLVSLSYAETPVTSTTPEKTTVVQGNHFYSNYEINTTYNIDKVSVQRPIILTLRKKDDSQKFDNNITINLISGDSSVQCKFVSWNGLCFLDKLPSANMVMKIRCDHLPCQASWTIMQPALNKLKDVQSIEEMYDISESSNHMIAVISCNNPEIKNFSQLVIPYSENEYVQGQTNNIIYLLFKKQKTGHLFFKIDPAAKSCAQMGIYNVKEELVPEKQLKDFVYANESSIYLFNSRPQSQFRIDCSFHEISKQPIKSQLVLTITGEKNGVRQTITTQNIKPSMPTTDYQFSWALSAIPSEYSNLKLQAKSTNNILIFNYFFSTSQRIEIQQSQHTYFKLKKGGILKFKLVAESDSEKSEEVLFFLSKPNDAKLSLKSCSKKDGCDFQIEALVDTEQVLYAGKSIDADTKGEVNFLDFKERITKKIRDEETIYLRTPVKKDEVVRVVVNNPNVIIRASSEQKCKVPSQQCYEHIANSHHHFIYEPKKDGYILMQVEGLDACVFTISVLGEGHESVELKDGEPFSYLMDDTEKKIYFKFQIPEKGPVSFNLIAPLNDLLLIVNNGKEKPNGDEHTASTDGYISYSKSELDSKQFRILVEKTPDAKHKFVHFTLIASTAGANLRLDPGVAHTESLKPKQHKSFVFQFDKKGDYIINFYTPNVDKKELDVKMFVSNENKWTDPKKVKSISLTQNSDVLDLKDISEELCIEQGDIQCQIFLRLANGMDIEIDITLTLLVKDSVIQLKDGLWQTYAINTVAKTSHFYFLPTTKNSSISIMYKSSLVDVGIAYTVWKSDKEDIDPTEWPFPPYVEEVNEKFSYFKSVNHIMIDTENLKGCWPTCVVLLSLYKKKTDASTNIFVSARPDNQGNFSLMVANKVFQVPQKTKIEVMLKANQQKYIMVDLKYSLKKQALTFFVNAILGSYSLFGSVYSEKHQRCPTVSDYDFNFGQLETQIKIASIDNKIDQNQMRDDKDYYLCILATGYLQSKFTIQFTSDEEIIKLLHYDTFERFQIQPRTPKLFQLQAQQQFELKFIREKGYFYVKIAVCVDAEGKDFQECLQDLKSGKDRGKQIITKTEQFTEKPCHRCIVFVKLDTDDPCQVTIHVQSQYSMIELKEKDVVSDFTNEEEVNRYSLTSVQSEETIINIAVLEGEPIVNVTNYGALEIVKQKDPKTGNIHIVIPPEKTKQNTVTALGGVMYDSFTYSNTFRYLVMTIKSKDPKKSTSYTVSFSSGERQVYLQDGLAVSYTLEPKKVAKFLYKNSDQVAHGYLSVSMAKTTAMYNLNFKMFIYTDPNDQDTRSQVTPEKPPMRKHTPNPTVVYTLPLARLVSVQIQSDTENKITLMILHQELVILPFDQQFPFELHKNETINLISDVNNPGYLLVTVRKCDQSSPEFGYTFDYDSFQKSQFEYTTNLADEPKFQFYIKASKIGTLYMQMNLTDQAGLFSISVHYSDAKIKGQKAKAGKNGVIQYTIPDTNKAKISFSPIVCSSSSKCDKNTKYYWMAGNNLQDVYTQTVCPYSFFQMNGVVSSQPLKINEISASSSSNGVISFDYPFKEQVTYLSVKAVSGTEEVYYQPLQIITVWGTVSRAGKAYYLFLIVGGALLLICSLICYRRLKKPGAIQIPGTNRQYQKLSEGREDLDF